ncbi:MAG TPA: cytochrome P450 [Gammaproteobacteria bacterium]|nr:cytochrome P450 [Gammaproteobacteria bacterium]
MTIPAEIASTIVDPGAYAQWDPVHAAFTELRRSADLDVAEPEGFDPFWVVTRYDDIHYIERQNELFHNGDRSAVLTTRAADAKVREITGGSPHLVRSLVQMDNPDHKSYRRLTQNWFMPQSLRGLEGRIREIAREFVDHMFARAPECDFARDVAFLYPLRVIMEVIGVPEGDEPRMLKLTQELFGSADTDLNRSGKEEEDADLAALVNEVVTDFVEYFEAMTEDRRAHPRDDLASVIANGTIDGEPLGHLEAMSYYIIAATAGHDTTSASTASGAWALAERPEQLARLKADMSRLPAFIEETVRWETPVKHFMRTATGDTGIRGRKIAKGDWLMLSYVSGNRDEDRFERPFVFDATRSPNKHVAFGYGPHVCLGQHLAKMEMRILWEELLPRLGSLELSGQPTRSAASFVSGPKSVPIRFNPA